MALTLLFLALAVGCRSAEDARGGAPPTALFLTNVDDLRRSPTHSQRWYALSRRLGAYRAFIVEQPEVIPMRSVRDVPVTHEQRAMLATAYRDEMRAALAPLYTVTDTPGVGVARIRSAITTLARSTAALTDARVDGGASREMEIVDSISGARLAAVIETDMAQDEHAPATNEPFHDARATFAHWSARLALLLADVDGLATQP